MANKPTEPPLQLGKYIETPMQTYYGVEDKVLYPHILFIIAILTVIVMALLT